MSFPEVREYRDSDAHDIAVCFNEQNNVWPGGFTQGNPLTADDIQRWHEKDDAVEKNLWAQTVGANLVFAHWWVAH